jgi:hypothetical protein
LPTVSTGKYVPPRNVQLVRTSTISTFGQIIARDEIQYRSIEQTKVGEVVFTFNMDQLKQLLEFDCHKFPRMLASCVKRVEQYQLKDNRNLTDADARQCLTLSPAQKVEFRKAIREFIFVETNVSTSNIYNDEKLQFLLELQAWIGGFVLFEFVEGIKKIVRASKLGDDTLTIVLCGNEFDIPVSAFEKDSTAILEETWLHDYLYGKDAIKQSRSTMMEICQILNVPPAIIEKAFGMTWRLKAPLGSKALRCFMKYRDGTEDIASEGQFIAFYAKIKPWTIPVQLVQPISAGPPVKLVQHTPITELVPAKAVQPKEPVKTMPARASKRQAEKETKPKQQPRTYSKKSRK